MGVELRGEVWNSEKKEKRLLSPSFVLLSHYTRIRRVFATSIQVNHVC